MGALLGLEEPQNERSSLDTLSWSSSSEKDRFWAVRGLGAFLSVVRSMWVVVWCATVGGVWLSTCWMCLCWL